MLKGIDVSHHNPNPDFAKAKEAGITFVYVKATEGKTYRDPQYQPNAFNALKAGLHLGFYHFARPDNDNKPEDEAKNFVDAISVFKYDLLPVLDLEVNVNISDEALYNWAKAFIDAVKAKTGHNVMLYTYLAYLNSCPALKKLATDGVPLWIAAYRSTPPVVNGWDWVMWQYTDKAEIPGIGKCDANNLVDLTKIMINLPKPQPTPKPQPAPKPQPKPQPKPATQAEWDKNPEYHRILKLTDPMMRGEDVKRVQAKLGITADGIFGPKTRDAVIAFQKKNGLTADGIVGPKTWAVLFQTRRLRVIVDQLWVYNKPDWNAKYKIVKKGDVFEVVHRYKVGDGYMYKLKSGLYITASPKYVELLD